MLRWPSASRRSIGQSVAGWCRDDLAPLMDTMEAVRTAKLNLDRIQFRAVE